jgi:glycosyltransferase involved in cell wall biosynthesis
LPGASSKCTASPRWSCIHRCQAGFPDIAWEDREDGVVCLGRFAPVKQLTGAVDIIGAVRAGGHNVHLHIIGTPEDPRYEAHLRALAATRHWLTLHVNLPRAQMVALVASTMATSKCPRV